MLITAISLEKKSFDFLILKIKDNVQAQWGVEKNRRNQTIAGNEAGLRQGVSRLYRDFKIRLFALSTTEVSKEAR